MLTRLLITASALILLSSCTVEPKPIAYGEAECDFCSMFIMDKQHAAELVTDKGRIYTFDAIECMVNYRKENSETEFAYTLVNDYQQPGELIPATESYYLISKEIPSPMGAYLSAFATKAQAEAMQQEKGGEVYDWPALLQYFDEAGLTYYEHQH